MFFHPHPVRAPARSSVRNDQGNGQPMSPSQPPRNICSVLLRHTAWEGPMRLVLGPLGHSPKAQDWRQEALLHRVCHRHGRCLRREARGTVGEGWESGASFLSGKGPPLGPARLLLAPRPHPGLIPSEALSQVAARGGSLFPALMTL